MGTLNGKGLLYRYTKSFCSQAAASCLLLSMIGLSGCAASVSELSHPGDAEQSFVLQQEAAFSLSSEPESAPESNAASSALTMDRAVAEALRASPELAQMRYRLDAAREQVHQAEAGFYPRLVLSQDFNATDNPVYALMNIINQRRLQTSVDFNDPGTQQNLSSRVQGDWMLFEGGRTWYEREAAGKAVGSAAAEARSLRNHLTAQVIGTYCRWLQSLAFMGVAEKALESARTDEHLGDARVKAEVALPSELARLKARTAEARSNLVSARSSTRRLQAAMERLLARPIQAEEIPDPFPGQEDFFPKPPSEDSASLVKVAMDRRPELASVKALIQAAEARVKASRGGLMPRVAANAYYQMDSEDWSDSADSWLVGFQATWPLFEGGVTMAGIREAQARLEELRKKGEQLRLDIALEVHQAFLGVQESMEKMSVAREREAWAGKALGEVREQYRSEVVGVDSLLQAELAWNQAEVSRAAAFFDVQMAQAVLKESLGGFVGSMEALHD